MYLTPMCTIRPYHRTGRVWFFGWTDPVDSCGICYAGSGDPAESPGRISGISKLVKQANDSH
jgi:hypothetical protein